MAAYIATKLDAVLVELPDVKVDSIRKMINEAYDKMGLTMRGYKKILKIARTIADIEESETIQDIHVAEALLYRINIEDI